MQRLVIRGKTEAAVWIVGVGGPASGEIAENRVRRQCFPMAGASVCFQPQTIVIAKEVIRGGNSPTIIKICVIVVHFISREVVLKTNIPKKGGINF